MTLRPVLSKTQYKYLASFLKTLSEGVVLGSSVAFFLPETLQLTQHISIERYLTILLVGLLLLFFGAMLERKGSK